MAKLTDKQKAFIEHYLQTWNATEAARRAEYKGTYESLRVIGSQNLTKPHIRKCIDERMQELTLTSNEVLLRLAQQAAGSIADFIDETGVVRWDKVKEKGHLVKRITHRKGREVTLEIHDAQSALVHLGRHYSLFKDRVQVEDWRTEIIQLLREGKITPEQVMKELGRDLATELFESAGIPITTS